MPRLPLAARVAGRILHALIGGLMLFAGFGKVSGKAPAEIVEGLAKMGLSSKIGLIGAGEIVAALLMLIPRTMPLGTLAVSGFWGGVICIHMAHAHPYAPWAAALAMTWVGAFLRDPRIFSSTLGGPTAIAPSGASL